MQDIFYFASKICALISGKLHLRYMKKNTSLKFDLTIGKYCLFALCVIFAVCLVANGQPTNQNPPGPAESLAQKISRLSIDEARAVLSSESSSLPPVDLERALNAQAEKLELDGDFNHAINLYQLSMESAQKRDDQKSVASSLIDIGTVHNHQGRYDQASECYDQSLKIGEAINDKTSMGAALAAKASMQSSRGSFQESIALWERSLALRTEVGDKKAIAHSLYGLADAHMSKANYDKAGELFQKALDISNELGNQAGIARNSERLGTLKSHLGEYGLALAYYQNSLGIFRELGDKLRIAYLLNNIGTVYFWQGKYDLQLSYLLQALEQFKILGDKAGLALALSNVGYVHRLQGNYGLAADSYRKGLDIYQELKDKSGIARALTSIASVHYLEHNYDEALKYYKQSLEMRIAIGEKDAIAITYCNMALSYADMNNLDLALEYLGTGLKLFQEVGDKTGIAIAENNISQILLRRGEYQRALEIAGQSEILAKDSSNLETLIDVRTTAGKAYHHLNQPEKARAALEDAIEITEDMRRKVAGGVADQQRFFEGKVTPFQAMVDFMVDQNNPTEALQYAERAKARVLLDILQKGRVKLPDVMTTSEREQERKLGNDLAVMSTKLYKESAKASPDQPAIDSLNIQLVTARHAFESFQTNLYTLHPELKLQRGETQSFKLSDVIQLVPNTGTALLQYVVMEDKAFLFVVTIGEAPGVELKVYPLGVKQTKLDDMVRNFRERLAKRDLIFRESATELYDILLKPAAKQLRGKSSLIIVPDGLLWELPFQALQTSASTYLIQDYSVSYAPSFGVLLEMRKHRQLQQRGPGFGPTLLAFGNPNLGPDQNPNQRVTRGDSLTKLPAAEIEVKRLGQLYGGKNSRVYTGAEASKSLFTSEAGHYQILHLATHGVVNNAQPMYSQVVLAQGKEKEGGLLEAWEIMKLDLKADVVVLSACETGLGRVGIGEGMIGLSWAFFVAGTPTTVVSQWKVDSTSTAELMLAFHGNLKMAKGSKADSLREAALSLLKTKQYRHPFYWASFVLVGDGY